MPKKLHQYFPDIPTGDPGSLDYQQSSDSDTDNADVAAENESEDSDVDQNNDISTASGADTITLPSAAQGNNSGIFDLARRSLCHQP